MYKIDRKVTHLSSDSIKPSARARIASHADINIPGIHILLNKKVSRLRRTVWIFMLMACVIVCLYQAIDRLLLFISSPVEMNTRIHRVNSIKFPSFTICPFDINSTPEIKIKQINYAQVSNGKSVKSVWSLLDFGVSNEKIWELNSINENNTKIKFEIKKTLPLTRPLSNLTKISNFAYLGTCMTVVTENEMDFVGTALVLNIKQVTENNYLTEMDSTAFTIYAHPDKVPVKHHAFFKGNIILRNHKTAIALTKTKFNYLNRSSYVCIDSVTAAYCWTNCIEDKLNKIASCRLPYMSKNVKNCTSSQESYAVYNETLKLYLETRQTDCNCPKPCDEEIYRLNADVQENDTNSTVLEVYFQSNTMEVIEEKYSYDLVAFMCDLGGNLGFYLGMSLLTILELAEYFLIWCKKFSKINQVTVNE